MTIRFKSGHDKFPKFKKAVKSSPDLQKRLKELCQKMPTLSKRRRRKSGEWGNIVPKHVSESVEHLLSMEDLLQLTKGNPEI